MIAMVKPRNLFFAIAAFLAACASGVSHAATCGITGSATATAATYDPFNPAGLPTTTIQLNLTRVNTSGGGDTRIVNFYLKGQSGATNGTSIVPTAVTGSVSYDGLSRNIFYDYSAAPPIYSPTSAVPSATNRFLKINFTGNNAGSDTAVVTFSVTLPANLDINASQNLSFDAFFACNIQGGQANGAEQIGQISNAVVFPIKVLSALQASYVGSALDFGEVGDKTTADVTATPATYTKPGNIRVASSGPYKVEMVSTNGYKLTFPGGTLSNSNHTLNYSATFLGQTRSSASPTFTAKTCSRAGLNAVLLPLSATLLEGGITKTPAPVYSDTITITVTPLVAGAPSQTDCP